MNPDIIQGHLLTMNERPFFNMVRLILLHGSKERYLLTNLGRFNLDVPSCLISFLSCLSLQCQSDLSISVELRQVARGFDYKVSSFNAYDVNGYRFHTTSYERMRTQRYPRALLGTTTSLCPRWARMRVHRCTTTPFRMRLRRGFRTHPRRGRGFDFLFSLKTLLVRSQPAPEATDCTRTPPTDCTRGG